MNNHTATVHSLYPDVNPAVTIPLTRAERAAIAVAAAVLAAGVAAGNLLAVAAGCVFMLVATIAPARKTRRRIRREAKDRFPDAGWVENTSGGATTVPLIAGFAWLAVGILAIALWWWAVPFGPVIAGASAAITMAVVTGLTGSHRA